MDRQDTRTIPCTHRGMRAPIMVLGLLCAQCVSANDDPFASTDLAFDEDVPVVLSASRLRQPVDESPASVTIIDRELIELSGARSLVDVLMLVPGFQVGYRMRGNPVATYHGAAQRYNAHLQLFVDGRPTYVPLFGGVPWHEVPIALDDIDRIEVTRAPNAATFGPNSFSTVISVTTREPAADSGWRGSLEAGGNEFASGTLSWHGKAGKTDYRFSMQASNDEGYEELPDTSRARLATLRGVRRLNETDRLTFDVGALRGGHVELDPIEMPELFSPYEETNNLYGQLVWERARSADDSWRIQYYYNRYDVDDDSVYTTDAGIAVEDPDLEGIPLTIRFDRDTRSSRHEVEVQRTQRLADNLRVVYGVAARRDEISGRYVFDDEDSHGVDTQRLFGHSEYEPHRRILLQAGMLAEHNSLSGSAIAPRVSMTWRTAPGQRFRLAYSRGLRTPQPIEVEGVVSFNYDIGDIATLRDVYISRTENELSPESKDVFDLGYHYTTFGGALSIDAKFSHEQIRDLLTNRSTEVPDDTFDGEARAFLNDDDFTLNHLDIEIDYRVSPRLRLRTGYALALSVDHRTQKFNTVPASTLSLFAGYRPARSISLSSEFYYVTKWRWADEPGFLTNIERLDLRAAKQFAFGNLEGEVALQAELELGQNADYVPRNDVVDQYFAKLSIRWP